MSNYPVNPMELFSVAGKVAIVGGATGAFGSVASKAYAAAGAKLVLVDIPPCKQKLTEVAEACRKSGAEVVELATFTATEEECNKVVQEAVKKFGGIDILFIASGKNIVSKIVDMAPERYKEVIDINLMQYWIFSRAAAKRMIEQGRGGKIVFMSSARGLLGHPAGYTAYCSSKSAVDGLTKALGCELGVNGITVNAIGPTVFRSPLTAWMFEDNENAKKVRDGFLSRVPMGRLGEPEDLVGTLLFLSSAASDFFTGHTMYADGGYTAG